MRLTRTVLVAAGVLLLMPGGARAGEMTRRFERSVARTVRGGPPFYTEELVLADVIPNHIRRLTNYSGDMSGRYIGNLSIISRQTGRKFPQLDRVVEAVLKLQRPDGHFGEPLNTAHVTNDNMAMIFGQARMMVGLLEYHKLTGRPEVLAAARRLGDYLISIAGVMNSDAVREEYTSGKRWFSYPAWTQNSQGLVELYQATKESKYLKLAEEMAGLFDVRPAVHGDYIGITIRAMVDLYNTTGQKRFLDWAVRDRNFMFHSGNIMIHGAVPEEFYPDGRRDEGCGITGWMGLNLQLWEATRELEYLEQAERTAFNGFPFNQFASGDFGNHVMTPTGTSYERTRAWWCCTQSGLRAFHDVFAAAFHSADGVLFYDLPVDGQGRSEGLVARADSTLAENGAVSIEILKADGARRALAVRKPGWAAKVEVSSGEPEARGGYLHISRAWRAGDKLTVRYEMLTRAVRDEGRPGQVALFHGPWLLGVDEKGSPHYFDEPVRENRILLPPAGAGGRLQLERAPQSEESRDLRVPVSQFKLDFVSAQCPIQPASALLRPISEHTTMGDNVPVEFWFRVK